MDNDINETRCENMAMGTLHNRLSSAIADSFVVFKQLYPNAQAVFSEATVATLASILHAAIQTDVQCCEQHKKENEAFARDYIRTVVDRALATK